MPKSPKKPTIDQLLSEIEKLKEANRALEEKVMKLKKKVSRLQSVLDEVVDRSIFKVYN